VSFDIDANGIVSVSTKEKSTGKEQQIRIQSSGGLSKDDIKRMLDDAEKYRQQDAIKREFINKKNEAESLIGSTEKGLEDFKGIIEEADVKTLNDGIISLRSAMAGEDTEKLSEEIKVLTDSNLKIFEAAYKKKAEQKGSSTTQTETQQDKQE